MNIVFTDWDKIVFLLIFLVIKFLISFLITKLVFFDFDHSEVKYPKKAKTRTLWLIFSVLTFSTIFLDLLHRLLSRL